MAKVLGVGGVFIKAKDPAATAAWYKAVLGFDVKAWNGAKFPHPDRGSTVWSVFPADTTHFEPSTAPFMVNYIVDDLDGVLARAEAEGVKVLDRSGDDGFGRFGWIMDPDGIKLELWEPKAEA
jgi:catechol 2,3-dioxygenase-like lactoylglutathione lyase family enzyme